MQAFVMELLSLFFWRPLHAGDCRCISVGRVSADFFLTMGYRGFLYDFLLVQTHGSLWRCVDHDATSNCILPAG
jgi:hypothetical protein